jgi:hypothetical protein
VVQIQPLGNGDSGESIAFRPADGLMYHWSGRSPTEIMETIDLSSSALINIPENFINYDPFEVLGSTYDTENDQFLVTDVTGQLSSVSTTGDWDTIATLPLGGERAIAFNGGALYIGDRFSDTLSDTDPTTGITNSTVAVSMGVFNVGGIISLTTDPASGTLYAILRDEFTGTLYPVRWRLRRDGTPHQLFSTESVPELQPYSRSHRD